MRLEISALADADIESIWQYIAQDNPLAADRTEAAMQTLAEFPGLGHTRRDVVNPDYRFWTVKPYVISYRVERDALLVIRVLRGARDFRRQLK